MVAIGMKLMPLKVIRNEVYSWVRGLFGLSKDLEPKGHPNTSRREESQEVRDSMKVEKGGVHHKRYDGHCTKQ
jgi:hypothetical protein